MPLFTTRGHCAPADNPGAAFKLCDLETSQSGDEASPERRPSALILQDPSQNRKACLHKLRGGAGF